MGDAMLSTIVSLDFESFSETDLPVYGLDRYSADPSTKILMASYSINDSPAKLWTLEDGSKFPAELRDALEDPEVIKTAFNAGFERVMTNRVLKIKSPIKNWRCTMALAYMQSFTGGLGEVGAQIELPQDLQKNKIGKSLIQKFCKPQKISKAQPFRIRDWITDPDDWETFGEYCIQDTITEKAVLKRLGRFPILDSEWLLYELDQAINDEGIPVDLDMVENGIAMAKRRKAELTIIMKKLTGLANPNSVPQLMGWLAPRGYPFSDLGKDTVKKVVRDHVDDITPEALAALNLRLQVSRTADRKYDAIRKGYGAPGPAGSPRIRYAHQFAGASRTGRWAGRRLQPQNMASTPPALKPVGHDRFWLESATDAVRMGDYDLVGLIVKEPLDAIAGLARSAIRAPDGYELRVCDLASIESVVIGWLSGCETLLNVFREGRDAYKDFACDLYGVEYADVTPAQRKNAKPGSLGCGYRLGGGMLSEDGKRTGLWGYAENMGVDLTLEESHKAVKVFREKYHEIPQMWYDLENAISKCIKTGKPQSVGVLKFEMMKPYLAMVLPSGRRMYYYKPRLTTTQHQSRDRKTNKPLFNVDGSPQMYSKQSFSYMGMSQKTKKWTRVLSHGGSVIENAVQGIARDILKNGMFAAIKAGFNVVLHVHDELATLQKISDRVHTLEKLRECMISPLDWAPDMPLNAAGYSAQFYFKD